MEAAGVPGAPPSLAGNGARPLVIVTTAGVPGAPPSLAGNVARPLRAALHAFLWPALHARRNTPTTVRNLCKLDAIRSDTERQYNPPGALLARQAAVARLMAAQAHQQPRRRGAMRAEVRRRVCIYG